MKTILTNSRGLHDFFLKSVHAETMRAEGYELKLLKDMKPPQGFDSDSVIGLIVGAPQVVDASLMRRFPSLRFVSAAGVGYDHIDLAAARELGVTVMNVPKLHARFGAEMVIAFIGALAKRIVQFQDAMREGLWQKEICDTIAGKTLGIVGLGSIGKEVAKMAGALGMHVMAFDTNFDQEFAAEHGMEKASLQEIISRSDFVTLHVPLTPETRNLINVQSLSRMKPSAYLINTARGGIVNEEDLLAALEKGTIAGAALDVFSKEPPFEDETLRKIVLHKKVIVSPHVATNTREWKQEAFAKIFENIAALEKGALDPSQKVT